MKSDGKEEGDHQRGESMGFDLRPSPLLHVITTSGPIPTATRQSEMVCFLPGSHICLPCNVSPCACRSGPYSTSKTERAAAVMSELANQKAMPCVLEKHETMSKTLGIGASNPAMGRQTLVASFETR